MILPLFGLDISGGSESKSLNVDMQERLNLYVETRLDSDKTRMTAEFGMSKAHLEKLASLGLSLRVSIM